MSTPTIKFCNENGCYMYINMQISPQAFIYIIYINI